MDGVVVEAKTLKNKTNKKDFILSCLLSFCSRPYLALPDFYLSVVFVVVVEYFCLSLCLLFVFLTSYSFSSTTFLSLGL